MAGNPLLFIGGAIAVAGVGYYLHQAGYFNKIFDAINAAIDKIGNTPVPSGGDGCSSGKIKCKDGKCDTQSKCDSQAKCKSGEHWNATSKKCAKASNLAMAYTTPQFSSGSHRAYLVN